MKHIVLLALNNQSGSALITPLEILSQVAESQDLKLTVATLSGGPVVSRSGLEIAADQPLAEVGSADAIMITSCLDYQSDPEQQTAALCWLREQHRQGTLVGALGTGIVFMALSGLLENRTATADWQGVSRLREAFPDVDFDPRHTLIECDGLVSCAGGYAGDVLSLYMVEQVVDAPCDEQNLPTGDSRLRWLVEHIRQAGEDIVQGQLVLRKGQRIKAADIGLLASLGMAKLTVHQKLTIAVCSTGDELTPPGEVLPVGHIYDSNRYVLHAMLQNMAVNIVDLGLLADDPDAIEAVFKEAMTTADVLITSAGVSVGSADYTKQVLDKLGKINFWKVAIKPGKPFAYGHLGKCVFFGLPGNPVAAVVTLEQLVQPVIRRMGGEQYNPMASFIATTQEALRKHPGRADYQRGLYWQQDSAFWVKTTANQSSGVLSSVAEANCFIVLPQDSGNVAAGEKVNVVPFSALLS